MSTTSSRIHALFFLSGISGLIYQVIWIRQIGNVLGVTVYSASMVTAVFMCGLGVGSYAAGAWSDRRYARAPKVVLAAYGWIEILIGCLGVVMAYALPQLAQLSASLSAYRSLPGGWQQLSTAASLQRYAAAVVLLAPSTVLMGATLTLLVRYLVRREVARAGWQIGLLYGLNTAGAALGCFATDFALIPRAGLLRTQLAAAALNGLVGLLAIAMSRRLEPDGAHNHPAATEAPEPAARSGRDRSAPRRPLVLLTASAILLSGLGAMGMEIVWFRFLTGSLGQYRSVLSLLLTVILVGIGLGSALGGTLHRRLGRPAQSFIVVQALFVATTMVLLLLFDPRWVRHYYVAAFEQSASGQPLSGWTQAWGILRSTALLAGVPALLMGCSFPLANANIQRIEAAVGRRVGVLYLANTVGAVLGALLTGFVLLPSFGSQRSILIVLSLSAAAILPLAMSVGTRARTQRSTVAALGLVAIALLTWQFGLPGDHLLRQNLPPVPPGSRIVSASEGIAETIVVTEDEVGDRQLWTNGHSMSGTGQASQRYMRAFAHIPLLLHEQPRRALVICFGVGTTAHAATLHSPEMRLDLVDISRHVLGQANYFAATNERVIEADQVQVYVNDGRQHLRMVPPTSYDLITLEPPPIAFAGVSALYGTEFYELARSRLTQGGFVTQWLPAYQVEGDAVLAMVRAFVEVFPASVLLSGERAEFILMGARAPSITLDPQTLRARLTARPRVQRDLARVKMGTLTELVGSFVATGAALREATAGVAPVSDDRPSMEYSMLSHFVWTRLPSELFHLEGITAWCPSCLSPDGPGPPVRHLDGYLRTLAELYGSEAFMTHAVVDRPVDHGDALTDLEPELTDAIQASPYLRAILPQRVHRPPTARRLAALERAVAERPTDGGAWRQLGLAHMALQRHRDAAAALEQAVELDGRDGLARLTLGFALERLGRHHDAMAQLEHGLRLTPYDVRAHYQLARLYQGAGRADDALVELGMVVELDPYHRQAHRLLCIHYAEHHDLRQAQTHCQRARANGAELSGRLLELSERSPAVR